MIRVGAGTATTLLKGGGMHRLMATTSIATGVANVVVSIALVRPLGLIGVALGTLIPVACSTFFVVYPAACRRVELPLRTLAGTAIWPALWPALALGGLFYALPLRTCRERSRWSGCSRCSAGCSTLRSSVGSPSAAATARCIPPSWGTCCSGPGLHQRRHETPVEKLGIKSKKIQECFECRYEFLIPNS